MESVVLVCVEAVGLCRLMAAADGLVHSVAVAKMETALEIATVICVHIPKHKVKHQNEMSFKCGFYLYDQNLK